jgi:hypothetical protein
MHPASFLAGLLIGVAAILVLLAALPGSQAAVRSTGWQDGIQRSLPALVQARVDQVGVQWRIAWNHLQHQVASFSISRLVRRPCQQFSNWFDQQDEKLVFFLAQHGLQVSLWLLPTHACG